MTSWRSERLPQMTAAPLRTLWDVWDKCVDEQLIPFRGKDAFWQHVPRRTCQVGPSQSGWPVTSKHRTPAGSNRRNRWFWGCRSGIRGTQSHVVYFSHASSHSQGHKLQRSTLKSVGGGISTMSPRWRMGGRRSPRSSWLVTDGREVPTNWVR